MKWCVVFVFLFCGCVTTASHTRRSDRVTARFSEVVTDALEVAHRDKPTLAPLLAQVRKESNKLNKIADEDPGVKFPSGLGSGLMGVVAMLAGPGCLGGAALAIKKVVDCNRMRGMIKDLSGMDKADSKDYVINHKVKV